MKINTGIEILALTFFCLSGCSKKNDTAPNNPPAVKNISAKGITIDNIPAATDLYNIKTVPLIKIVFSEPVEKNSIASSAKITDNISGSIPYTSSLE